jgi:hypothetical protein
VMSAGWRWLRSTYLELENIVDLVEFLLIPILQSQTLVLQLLIDLCKANGRHSSTGSCLPCSGTRPLHGCVIPGSKLLERLLGVLVAFPSSGLREGALGSPGNGCRSGCRGSRAHTADLRCGAHKGHCAWQLAGKKLWECFWVG